GHHPQPAADEELDVDVDVREKIKGQQGEEQHCRADGIAYQPCDEPGAFAGPDELPAATGTSRVQAALFLQAARAAGGTEQPPARPQRAQESPQGSIPPSTRSEERRAAGG